jgi:hypothetical protein
MNNFSFINGTAVTFTALVGPTGAPVDPTTLSFSSEDPTGTKAVVTWAGGGITRASVGNFSVTTLFNLSGRWLIRFVGTGNAAVAFDGQVDVPPSPLA